MAWVTDSNYRILMQDQQMSCGLCSCAMVINILRNAEFSESTMVNESRKITTKEHLDSDDITTRYTGYTGDRSGYKPTFMRSVHNITTSWGEGTFGMHLSKILQANGVQGTYGTGSVKSAMQSVSKNQLLIIRVASPGHWVVIAKQKRNLFSKNEFTILDPGANQVVKIKGYINFTHGRTFTPYWVKCTKAVASQQMRGVLSSIDMQAQRRRLHTTQTSRT